MACLPRLLHATQARAWRTAVAVLLAPALLLGGCRATPSEEALRASVEALEVAIEARDPGAVADLLADDFVGPDGMDRDAARRLAQLAFLRSREVAVTLGPLDLDLHDGDGNRGMRATVSFTAALAGGSGRLLPESGSIYRVQTGWTHADGEWKLASARWERDL